MPVSGPSSRIQYTLQQSSDIHLVIYNMFGKPIYSVRYMYGENGGRLGKNTVSIPMEFRQKLSIGPYFILIHDGQRVMGRGSFAIK